MTTMPIVANIPTPALPHARRFSSVLPMNEVLQVGDLIVSDNGLFFATLREDGCFAIYRGIDDTDPDALLWESTRKPAEGPFFALVQGDGNFCIYQGTDLEHNAGWHWGSQMTAKGNRFYGTLQDDGNFSIRKGSSPQDSCGLIWASGATDRVESIVEVLHIEYELEQACVLRTSPASLYSETINNTREAQETHRVLGAIAVTETTAWTNAMSARYCADSHFRAPVPIMDGDEFRLCDEAKRYEPNGAQTSTRNWGFNTPVCVEAQTAVRAAIAVTYSTIAVPYVLLGQLRFESGVRVIGPVKGAFLGTNAHSLVATFAPQEPKPNSGKAHRRSLQPVLEVRAN
ncbi:hypothetical protein AB4Z19_18105 [Pseudoduganella sp. RAF19]|uniref:hypothetical protein n=2 Tax=unclassified Pseudoduganella TaxID=2637179 RepID=UPI003F9826DD